MCVSCPLSGTNKYDLNNITSVLEENKLSWLRVSRPVQHHPRSQQCPWVCDIWSHVFSCLEPGEVSRCVLSCGLPGGKADSCWPGPQLPSVWHYLGCLLTSCHLIKATRPSWGPKDYAISSTSSCRGGWPKYKLFHSLKIQVLNPWSIYLGWP